MKYLTVSQTLSIYIYQSISQIYIFTDLLIHTYTYTIAESTSSGKSSKKPSSDKQQISVQAQIETIDQNWFIGHATQVRQSLQGGLDVVGLYIYAPTELTIKTTSTAAKLRQLVFALGALAGSEPTVTADRYLVHVCSSTKKKILRTYNTADYRVSHSVLYLFIYLL